MTINIWPLAERPREKLLQNGPSYLSDAELLAIFIRTGVRGKTAVDVGRELIIQFGSLRKFLQSHPHEIYKTPGLGKAKYAVIQAALELGRRYLSSDVQIGEVLNDSTLTKQFLALRLRDLPHEVFACLFLDNANKLICFEELFQGTLTEASVYPREVVKRGLANNAAKIILAHNHPSGDPTPSQADKELTKVLKNALELVDIVVIDHIVVGVSGNISFAELGLF